jgi:hypothetical protein
MKLETGDLDLRLSVEFNVHVWGNPETRSRLQMAKFSLTFSVPYS